MGGDSLVYKAIFRSLFASKGGIVCGLVGEGFRLVAIGFGGFGAIVNSLYQRLLRGL